MRAVWPRLRSELRARWRSWLGLALLIGLIALAGPLTSWLSGVLKQLGL
jgi:hypothetical protein